MAEVNNNREKLKNPKRILVSHGTGVYDVTSFAKIHPGGAKYLSNFNNKDISGVMDGKTHSHGPYAYRWMAQYRVGFADNFPEITPPEYSLPDIDAFGLNWSKPMVFQVGSLRDKYPEWLEIPTDRTLRLFRSDICEYFSITRWFVIPLVWIPIVCLLLMNNQLTLSARVWCFGMGIFWWTLVEYVLHRFIFHLHPFENKNSYSSILTDNGFYITFHFLLHGQHHKVPFDKGRLVFPVVPAALLVLMFRSIFHHLSGHDTGEALMAGGIFGYVCYDMIHYFTHYGSIKKDTWLDRIRKYHIEHHFVDPNKGYGISTSLWDYPFQTIPEKKRQKKQ